MFDKVIVGVDGQQGGSDAIALAEQLAAPGASLTLAHVYGGHTSGGEAQRWRWRSSARPGSSCSPGH
jgi:nucleotide-binding universal stress UspA family protein